MRSVQKLENSSTNVVVVRNAVKRRAWRTPINFSMGRGETVVLTGPNGSGKSTLMQLVIGILRPEEGEVRTFGVDPFRRAWVRRRVAVAFQDLSLEATLPISESLGLHARLFRGHWTRVVELLERFELDAGVRPLELSGGQKRRVELVKALIQDAELYAFDEPTANLDREGAECFLEAARVLKASGKTMLFLTHDPAVLPLADREVNMMTLKQGGGEVEKRQIVLELSTWNGELDEAIRAVPGVLDHRVEPNPEVLERFGITAGMVKQITFVKPGEKGRLDKLAEAGATTLQHATLFDHCRLRVETAEPEGTLAELLMFLANAGVRVYRVIEGP